MLDTTTTTTTMLIQQLNPHVRKHLIKVYSTFTMAVISATFGCYMMDVKGIIYFFEIVMCLVSSVLLKFSSNTTYILRYQHGSSKTIIRAKIRQSIRLIVFVCGFAFFLGGILRPLVGAVWDIDSSVVVNVLLETIAMFVCLTFSILCAPSNVYSLFKYCTLFIILCHLILKISYTSRLFWYTTTLYFTLITDICNSIMKVEHGDNDYILHCFYIFSSFTDFVAQILHIKLKKIKK